MDLENIYKFIATDSKYIVKRQISKIKIRTESLKSFTLLGRSVSEFNNPNLREVLEGNYRIIYRVISKSEIDIITRHHTSKENLKI